MGLISLAGQVLGAGVQGVKGSLQSSMFIEYFECGQFGPGGLMKRAEKRTGKDSKNTKADDNLISSGSIIDVPNGTCAILVDSGAIVDFVAQAGQYRFDSSSQPSCICGENKGLKAVGKEILKQWSAGGQRVSSQRVFFINTSSLNDSPIKWGFGDVPYHHVQQYASGILEMDLTLKGNGYMTAQIVDPIAFFNNFASARMAGGDTDGIINLKQTDFDTVFKGIAVDSIAMALSELGSTTQTPYTALRSKTKEIASLITEEINKNSANYIGLGITGFFVNGGFNLTDDSATALKEYQTNFINTQNANMMNYDIQKRTTEAMAKAGEHGGMNGLIGMGMAMNSGMGGLGQMQYQQNPYMQQQQMSRQPMQQPVNAGVVAAPVQSADTWTCECGAVNDGKFCKSCGKKKPEPVVDDGHWTCECGAVNDGKFCKSCGKKKPSAQKHFKCDKCGWEGELEVGMNFCPECGDPVTEADMV